MYYNSEVASKSFSIFSPTESSINECKDVVIPEDEDGTPKSLVFAYIYGLSKLPSQLYCKLI